MANEFDKLFGYYMPVLDDVAAFLESNCFRYGFIDPSCHEQMAKDGDPRVIQIYWQEILLMAHLAAVTSLLRSRSWLRSAIQAIDDGSAIAFSACFRGFLEAASDTYDALGGVPEDLVKHRSDIVAQLTRRDGSVFLAGDLEARLIHFIMARELAKGESAPESHRSKQASEYFVSLDKSRQGPIRAMYRELCELSHPSRASVFLFLQTENTGHLRLDQSKSKTAAVDILSRHDDAAATAFHCGINICLISLKALNEFPMEQLHTPLLDSIGFDNLPLGARIRTHLGKTRW